MKILTKNLLLNHNFSYITYILMKKIWHLTMLLICGLLLTGCNCRCDVAKENHVSLDSQSSEAKKICLENKWTYSRVTSPDEEYWECMFQSWIWCRDEYVVNWECQRKANVDDIDTKEERFAQCQENVTSWFHDMIWDVAPDDVEYADEQEIKDENWEITIINLPFKIYYTKDWQNRIIDWVCEANFVQWGMWTTFSQEYLAK